MPFNSIHVSFIAPDNAIEHATSDFHFAPWNRYACCPAGYVIRNPCRKQWRHYYAGNN